MSSRHSLVFLCVVVVCEFVPTCKAQGYAAIPDPDALADLTLTVLAHNGTNNSSGVYLGILLSLYGDKQAFAVEAYQAPPISGERCVTLQTVLLQNFANATLHQNDPIVGGVVLPLQGERKFNFPTFLSA
ncbi:hypothetical protein BV898_07514 [Hypsibius exemplaris]|uniref:Uncharacterized protein n=1 Tax=Hypsibius exemplaris TaxID=2072580 RepID=A0A1W0WTI9_HYPEX|nr:hypothetical protein BV898_07514 [Hypsibius exemplaris]